MVSTGIHKSAPYAHPHPRMCTHHTCTRTHVHQALGPTTNTAETALDGPAYSKRLGVHPGP